MSLSSPGLLLLEVLFSSPGFGESLGGDTCDINNSRGHQDDPMKACPDWAEVIPFQSLTHTSSPDG